MMFNSYLFSVKDSQVLEAVMMNGSPIALWPTHYDALQDKNGIIHTIYLKHSGGQEFNLLLLPRNLNQIKAAKFIAEWLLPHGISFAANRLINTHSKVIRNAVSETTQYYTKRFVNPLYKRWRLSNSCYYDFVTASPILRGPIKISS